MRKILISVGNQFRYASISEIANALVLAKQGSHGFNIRLDWVEDEIAFMGVMPLAYEPSDCVALNSHDLTIRVAPVNSDVMEILLRGALSKLGVL